MSAHREQPAIGVIVHWRAAAEFDGGSGGPPPRSYLPTGLNLYQATTSAFPTSSRPPSPAPIDPSTTDRGFRDRDDATTSTTTSTRRAESDVPTGYDLSGPGWQRIHYNPTSTSGVYQAVGTPTDFYGSMLSTSGPHIGAFTSTITLPDGTVYSFGDNNGLLTGGIADRYGNTITITRTPGSSADPGNEGPETVTTTDGRWMEFTYGPCLVTTTTTTDCVTSVTDNIGQTTSYEYDTATGQMTQSTDANGGVTTYAWASSAPRSSAPRSTSFTDPLNNTTSTVYNPAGQVSSQTDPDGGKWTFSYATGGAGTETTTMTDRGGPRTSSPTTSTAIRRRRWTPRATSVQETTTDDFDSTPICWTRRPIHWDGPPRTSTTPMATSPRWSSSPARPAPRRPPTPTSLSSAPEHHRS